MKIIYEQVLALNNLQRLIYQKHNQPTLDKMILSFEIPFNQITFSFRLRHRSTDDLECFSSISLIFSKLYFYFEPWLLVRKAQWQLLLYDFIICLNKWTWSVCTIPSIHTLSFLFLFCIFFVSACYLHFLPILLSSI